MHVWRRKSRNAARAACQIRLKSVRLAAHLLVPGAVFLSVLVAAAQNPTPPPAGLRSDRIDLPTPINQAPDAVAQMRMANRAATSKRFAAINAERKKRITEAASKLIELTGELNAALEKSVDAPMDLNLMRKVDEIEMAAHAVKEEMKLSVTAK